MSNLQGNQIREQPGIRPQSGPRPVDAFEREEADYFRLAPIALVEERLLKLTAAVDRLGTLAQKRRAALEAERCYSCGGPFKRKDPTDRTGRARLPYGTELLVRPGQDNLHLYSCDASCHAKLQFDVEKGRVQLKMEDEQLALEGRAAASAIMSSRRQKRQAK